MTAGAGRGSVAVFSMSILGLLLLAGVAVNRLARTELETAVCFRDGVRAEYLAEAGVRHAAARLAADEVFASAVNEAPCRPENVLTELPGAFAEGGYRVYITGGGADNRRTIVSISRVGGVRRRLTADVILPGDGRPPRLEKWRIY